jgi:hypothetical protein
MTTIRIALQDGFEDDTVVINVDGREVFRQETVKTKRQIGKATSFEIDLEEGQASVEISLPLRKLYENIGLRVSGEVYLGISVVDGKIQHHISSSPFRYA